MLKCYVMLAASLPSRSLRSNNGNSLSVLRVKTNTGARAFHSLEQPRTVCPFSHFSCYLISEDTSLWLDLSPIDTVTPHGLLLLRNCFLDFAVEHWFGCRATEPGFAGGIGTIVVWLIYWLIDRSIDWLLIWTRIGTCYTFKLKLYLKTTSELRPPSEKDQMIQSQKDCFARK